MNNGYDIVPIPCSNPDFPSLFVILNYFAFNGAPDLMEVRGELLKTFIAFHEGFAEMYEDLCFHSWPLKLLIFILLQYSPSLQFGKVVSFSDYRPAYLCVWPALFICFRRQIATSLHFYSQG